MQLLTIPECKTSCEDRQIKLDDRGHPLRALDGQYALRCAFPKSPTQFLWFCQFIERSLQPRESCLLWVTDWGIFCSAENLHLYYKLRQAYGDHRLLHEAPGHLFLKFESDDLVTFIELSMLSGWDAYLLPTVGYAWGFISHHEEVELVFQTPEPVEQSKAELSKAGIELLPPKVR